MLPTYPEQWYTSLSTDPEPVKKFVMYLSPLGRNRYHSLVKVRFPLLGSRHQSELRYAEDLAGNIFDITLPLGILQWIWPHF